MRKRKSKLVQNLTVCIVCICFQGSLYGGLYPVCIVCIGFSEFYRWHLMWPHICSYMHPFRRLAPRRSVAIACTRSHDAAYTARGLSGAPPRARESTAIRRARCRRCNPNPPPLRLHLNLKLSRLTANRLARSGGGAVNQQSPAKSRCWPDNSRTSRDGAGREAPVAYRSSFGQHFMWQVTQQRQ